MENFGSPKVSGDCPFVTLGRTDDAPLPPAAFAKTQSVAMIAALLGLAFTAFLAATPLPLPSEPVFMALQATQAAPVWALVVVASIANTAGSVVTWAMGRGLRIFGDKAAPDPQKLAKAEAWFQRWGRWSLLLSWAPLGDVLCLIAGTFRVPLWQFVPIVGLGKTLRYILLAGLVGGGAALLG